MSKRLLIFPFGGNAREALAVITDINKIKKTWDVIGFIDDDRSRRGRICMGIEVIGGREVLGKYRGAYLLAVPGNPDNYMKRRMMLKNLRIGEKDYATIIHPSAVVAADAKVGFNTVLMANVVIGSGAVVGNHCVMLPNTVVGHDSTIGDYTVAGANVTVSGGVDIEENCYIGSGSSLRDGIRIGKGSLIGIGSTVIADVKPGIICAGNPARTIRKVAP